MPANLVRPGTEQYWTRAKKRAAEQGHEKDWPYVVGIYKRMTVNKAEDEPEDGAELEKGAMGGPNAVRYFINARQGGQVPSRERLRALAEAYRSPQAATTARLLDSGKPVYRLSDVFAGLGLDPDAQASWEAMLGPVIEGSGNDVALRQAIYATMRERKADGALGSAVLERALRYRASRLQKGGYVQLVTVDELRKAGQRWRGGEPLSKAEARGGSYYRRVMGKSGRFRYYYDQDKYEQSPEAHLDGEGASKRAIKARLGALLEKAGKAGVSVADLKGLTKRYGAKRVAGVLKSARQSGELIYKAGKLRAQARRVSK